MPYFLIGDILSKLKPQIKSKKLALLAIFFVFTTLLERFVLGTLNLNSTRDHYISTTFLSVSVFLFAINSKNTVHNHVYEKCCFIGSKLSLGIYIIHPILIPIISKVISIIIYNDSIKIVFDYVCPLIVFVASIIVSFTLNILEKKIRVFNSKQKIINKYI